MLNLIPLCIILRYSEHLDNCLGFIFRYTHANVCTIKYCYNLWTRFLCGLLSVSIYNCFRQKSVHLSLPTFFTFNTDVVTVVWTGQNFKCFKIRL